jgi:hypothetical protein
MTERDAKGRFVKGQSGNPAGRGKAATAKEYMEVIAGCVSAADVREIVERAKRDAKRGNDRARRWLFDYLIGKPVERVEMSGADGAAIRVEWVNDWRDSAAYASPGATGSDAPPG